MKGLHFELKTHTNKTISIIYFVTNVSLLNKVDFLAFRLDFKDQANEFRIRDFTVSGLLQKNRKKFRFDPYWRSLRVHLLLLSVQSK